MVHHPLSWQCCIWWDDVYIYHKGPFHFQLACGDLYRMENNCPLPSPGIWWPWWSVRWCFLLLLSKGACYGGMWNGAIYYCLISANITRSCSLSHRMWVFHLMTPSGCDDVVVRWRYSILSWHAETRVLWDSLHPAHFHIVASIYWFYLFIVWDNRYKYVYSNICQYRKIKPLNYVKHWKLWTFLFLYTEHNLYIALFILLEC